MAKRNVATLEANQFTASAVHGYDAELHRFLRRRVRHVQDQDDLAQEVYLRLLRVKNTDLVRNPLAYIYGVAGHVVREFNLRERKGRVVFDSPTAEAVVESHQSAQSVHAGGHFERQTSDALAQLTPQRLAVLLLERRDGLSREEIAEKLGLSVHTVKKYAVEALAHVRASLER